MISTIVEYIRLNFIGGVLGFLLIITGILDSFKYHWEAKKIRAVGTAKGHSRQFINVAIYHDVVRVIYLLTINRDWYLLLVSLIALYTMFDMFWAIYTRYPYKMRGCPNFKRPNIVLYFINSTLPNQIRKKL